MERTRKPLYMPQSIWQEARISAYGPLLYGFILSFIR